MALHMDAFTILMTDELAELQPGRFLRAVDAEPSPDAKLRARLPN